MHASAPSFTGRRLLDLNRPSFDRRGLDEITDRAVAAFGQDEAHRFLNADDAMLGGRPSRVAAESDTRSILDAEMARRRVKGGSA